MPYTWVERLPATSPTAGASLGGMSRDANDKVVLVNPSGETWTWDGTDWTQESPATTLLLRHSFGFAYHASSAKTVIWSGRRSVAPGFPNDTWTWDGTDWTLETPATSPTWGRQDPSLAAHPPTDTLVMFGGVNDFSAPVSVTNDTWSWDGTTWTEESPAHAPTARTDQRMAYHAPSGKAVMFGGSDAGGYTTDTWTWDGTDWTDETSAHTPPVRQHHYMAYHASTGRVLVFGGETIVGGVTTIFNDLWAWDGTDWTELFPSSSPSTREASAMTADPSRDEIVLFGGVHVEPVELHDTWVYYQTGFAGFDFKVVYA